MTIFNDTYGTMLLCASWPIQESNLMPNMVIQNLHGDILLLVMLSDYQSDSKLESYVTVTFEVNTRIA